MKIGFTLALAMFALVSNQCRAAVNDLAANGFEVEETIHIAASAETVYGTLIQPALWWSSEHTYSGNAANMSFDAQAGGCWCERLAGGGAVQHMQVTMIQPGKSIVLRGGLGPLTDQAVAGAMRWSLKSAGAETDFTLTYKVAGYIKGGFGALPTAIDGVLHEQVAGLKRASENRK